MIVKFNPTGTHIHKGFLKIRLDLYPEPTDKTYALHYVDKPDTPYEPSQQEIDSGEIDQTRYDDWWANVSKHKELNPCLCHFLTIDTSKSKTEIIQEIKGLFDSETLRNLDDALILEDSAPRVSQIMRTKLGSGNIVGGNLTKLVKATNILLSNVEVAV